MKIGVVIAIDSELTYFLKKLPARKEKIAGWDVYRVRIGGNDGYVVKSGAGEIASASATQFLISVCGVDVIANMGVAGSLDPELKVGDAVLVTGVVHYDFDTSAIDDCEAGRYLEFPSVVIPTDYEMAEKMLGKSVNLKRAIVASGDKFIADNALKNRLRTQFGAGLAEMESAGVVITAKRNGKPVVIVKIISDNADENAVVDFPKMFEVNADIIFNFLS